MSRIAFISFAAAAAIGLSTPVLADTITFDALPGANQDVFKGSYVESGFTVTATSGIVRVATVFGNPNPSLYTGGFGGSSIGSIDVTYGGGLFSLASFDLSPFDSAAYTVTGYVGGSPTQLVDDNIAFQNGGPDFTTILTGSTKLFDRVSFGFYAPGSQNSVNIDNIVVKPASAPVPEPASWALMIGGLGLVGGVARRRRATIRTAVSYS